MEFGDDQNESTKFVNFILSVIGDVTNTEQRFVTVNYVQLYQLDTKLEWALHRVMLNEMNIPEGELNERLYNKHAYFVGIESSEDLQQIWTDFGGDMKHINLVGEKPTKSRRTCNELDEYTASEKLLIKMCGSAQDIKQLNLTESRSEIAAEVMKSWQATVRCLNLGCHSLGFLQPDLISTKLLDSVETLIIGYKASMRNYYKHTIHKDVDTLKKYMTAFKNLKFIEFFNFGFMEAMTVLSAAGTKRFDSVKVHRLNYEKYNPSCKPGDVYLRPHKIHLKNQKLQFTLEWSEKVRIFNKMRGCNIDELFDPKKNQLVLNDADYISFEGGIKVTWIPPTKLIPTISVKQRGSKLTLKINTSELELISLPIYDSTEKSKLWFIHKMLDGKLILNLNLEDEKGKEAFLSLPNFQVSDLTIALNPFSQYDYTFQRIMDKISKFPPTKSIQFKVCHEQHFVLVHEYCQKLQKSLEVSVRLHEVCEPYYLQGTTSLVDRETFGTHYVPGYIYQ